jgi:hypothetical protein
MIFANATILTMDAKRNILEKQLRAGAIGPWPSAPGSTRPARRGPCTGLFCSSKGLHKRLSRARTSLEAGG